MLLTVENFVEVFGFEECAQIAGTGPREMRTLDRVRIEEALIYASSMVIGYIINRWPDASSGTPLLKGFAFDIARWRLRGRGGQQASMNEVVQKRYDEAIARLKDLAAGKLALDVVLGSSGSPSNAQTVDLQVSAHFPSMRAPHILQGY